MSTEKVDEKQDGTTTENELPSFESLNIPPHIVSALYDMRYENPSEIQIKALPKLMETPPRNFVGQAQTGSGKTATFLIAALNCIQQELMKPQVIVVAPTRELVTQITDVAVNLSKYMKIKVRKLILPPDDLDETYDDHLIVGLPNVLKLCIQNDNINLQMLRMIILDEADELLVISKPLYSHTIPFLKKIPKTAQRVLFSATISTIKPDTLNSYFPNAEKVELSADKLSLDEVVQFFVLLATVDERMQFLRDLYNQFAIGQLIVFVQTTERGNQLADFLRDDKHQVSVVRGGDMTGAERDTALESFRKGVTRVLVSTNVVARGIDISQVNIVINFDVPRQPDQLPDHDTYLHRIGRAGRYGRVGVALTFVDENETELIEYFSWYFKKTIFPLNTFDELKQWLPSIDGKAPTDPTQALPVSVLQAAAVLKALKEQKLAASKATNDKLRADAPSFVPTKFQNISPQPQNEILPQSSTSQPYTTFTPPPQINIPNMPDFSLEAIQSMLQQLGLDPNIPMQDNGYSEYGQNNQVSLEDSNIFDYDEFVGEDEDDDDDEGYEGTGTEPTMRDLNKFLSRPEFQNQKQ